MSKVNRSCTVDDVSQGLCPIVIGYEVDENFAQQLISNCQQQVGLAAVVPVERGGVAIEQSPQFSNAELVNPLVLNEADGRLEDHLTRQWPVIYGLLG